MWTWSLNWADITPSIVVGTCPMTPDDLERIHREAGCTALLSVQHDDCLAYWGIDEAALRERGRRLGLTMARRPMRDFDLEDQRHHLAVAVAELAAMQSAGQRTYVHCTAGLGRAPLTVWSYLTWVEGYPSDAAVALVKERRAGAVPSPEAHEGCRADLLTRHRAEIERRSRQDDSGPDTREAERASLRSVLLGMARAR